jgi:hypothetical protein
MPCCWGWVRKAGERVGGSHWTAQAREAYATDPDNGKEFCKGSRDAEPTMGSNPSHALMTLVYKVPSGPKTCPVNLPKRITRTGCA